MKRFTKKVSTRIMAVFIVAALFVPSLPQIVFASVSKAPIIKKDIICSLDFEDTTMHKSRSTVVLCDANGKYLLADKNGV